MNDDGSGLSPLAERVLTYLRASIAERGGKGRRPSIIEMEMEGPEKPFTEIVIASNELERAGLVRWERNEIMGWYVILREAEQ